MKSKIIIGGEEAGKTRLARGFISAYKEKQAPMIDGKNFNLNRSFPFELVTSETRLIVFDDLPIEKLQELISVFTDTEIEIKHQNRWAFTMRPPSVIFGMDSKVTLDEIKACNLHERFNVIELKKHL